MPTQTCPICESHLTGDAVQEGCCQCCGSPLPKAKPDQDVETDES